MEWLSFNFVDILDILLFSVLLYYLFKALRKGGNSTLLVGIITFVMMWVLFSRILGMRLMGRIMDYMMGMGLLVLVILFQDDIRRFLTLLGSTNKWLSPEKIFRQRKRDQAKQQEASYIAMMTRASDCWLTPSPERCRRPISLGSELPWATGRMHAAARMCRSRMISAPSWSGEPS